MERFPEIPVTLKGIQALIQVKINGEPALASAAFKTALRLEPDQNPKWLGLATARLAQRRHHAPPATAVRTGRLERHLDERAAAHAAIAAAERGDPDTARRSVQIGLKP